MADECLSIHLLWMRCRLVARYGCSIALRLGVYPLDQPAGLITDGS